MDAPCEIQGNIHVLLCLIHKINVSRILGTYHCKYGLFSLIYAEKSTANAVDFVYSLEGLRIIRSPF